MTSAVRSLLLVVGLAVAALGATLTARPFTSVDTLTVLVVTALAAMAVGELLGSPRPWTWSNRLAALVWLTAAIVVGTQPGIDIDILAIVVGAAMMVEGVVRVVEALRGKVARQFATLSFGLSGVVLGVLTLATPDATVLLVAVLLGIRVLWFGITLFWNGVRGTFDEKEPFQPGSVRRITTTVASAVALVLAFTLGGVSTYLHEGRPDKLGELVIPAEVPKEPGKLVSFEEFDTNVPRGARAWRILYTTTRDDGEPALSTGLIIADEDAGSGPRPVIAWAHGTTGIARSCAPSSDTSRLTFVSIPGLDDALDEGWAVVTTDYIGLGTPGPHPYLIGQGEGRSVLDAVRAAHEFDKLDLSDQTVVWGHSQGGGAALWAGILAEKYAPSVDIVGVAGIAPATDLIGLVDNIVRSPFGILFAAYVIESYSAAYPDVSFDAYITPAARSAMKRAAGLCVRDHPGLASLAQEPGLQTQIYASLPTSGALGERLRENIPYAPIPAPTLIIQGEKDLLVLPSVQDAFVARRCTSTTSGPLEYRTYSGREHTDIVAASSPMIPGLLSWSADRFDGKTAPSNC